MSGAAKRGVLGGGIAAGGDRRAGDHPRRSQCRAPAPRGTGDRLFTIEKGQSLSRISRQLQAQGFIRFAPLLDVAGAAARARRGISRRDTTGSRSAPRRSPSTDLLVAGRADDIGKVTIPEGWTSGKIARHLEAEGRLLRRRTFSRRSVRPRSWRSSASRGSPWRGSFSRIPTSCPRPFPGQTFVELMVRTFFDNLGRIAPGWKDLGQEKLRGHGDHGLHRGTGIPGGRGGAADRLGLLQPAADGT